MWPRLGLVNAAGGVFAERIGGTCAGAAPEVVLTIYTSSLDA